MRPALRLGVVYDFRNTRAMAMTNADLYSSIIDQVAWLDRLGLDLCWFTEHHFVEDGYLASRVPVAAAIAARIRNIRFSCDVCLLPFNHPIRLAEDLAVLDTISNGRVEIGVGMGYAPHEFAGFGIPFSRRVSLTDEGIEILHRANANLLPQGPRIAVLDPWEKATRAAGRDPNAYRVGIIKSCLVTDDPDRD